MATTSERGSTAHRRRPAFRREVFWPPVRTKETPGALLWFCLTAVLVGAATGVVARGFAVLLEHAATHRAHLVEWAQPRGVVGVATLVAAAGVLAAAAAALVRYLEPHAEGSGIPRVEAIVDGNAEPGSARILPVKFAGGLLSLGAGLGLGREGPSVQMGASVAAIVGRLTRRGSHDLRLLIAAGAAAGLATAFNAPIAGGVFVLEELLRRFDTRASLATLLASGTGFAASQLVYGETNQMFAFISPPLPVTAHIPLMLTVGLVCGLLAFAHNWLLILALRWGDRSRFPRVWRAALIGMATGVVLFVAPGVTGGGDPLTQQALLAPSPGLAAVAGVLVFRLIFGIVSYLAATPGGIFAPMLVLGSHVGLLVGLLWLPFDSRVEAFLPSLAVIGIAAFFTASVQVPVTGVVLATELTGATGIFGPMLGACAVALIVAMVLRSRPVYEALAKRAARAARENKAERATS